MTGGVAEAAERQLRLELSRGITILERLGIVDFNGHFSARLSDGSILVNSGSSVRSAISADDFVLVQANGQAVEDEPRPPAELPLHLAVYAARSDVHAIVHGHPSWSTLLSSAGVPWRVVFAQGALLGDVPVYASPRSVNNETTAAEVAALLGGGRAVMLRAHGSVVAAGDVVEATVLAIYMEMNAERQVRASALGSAYEFPAEEQEACRRGLMKRGLFDKCWDYYCAKFGLAGQP